MFVVVSYDIVDDKRRRKVMKKLEGYGVRAQYSVFECDLEAPKIVQLRTELNKLINKKEDDIRFYQLCEECVPRAIMLGKARLVRERAFRII